MVEKKLEDYITKLMKKGYSKNFIKEQLLKAGYAESDIMPSLNTLEEQFYPKDTSKKWHFIAALASVVILIIATFFFLYRETGIKLCKDTSCFEAAANACEPVQYYEDIEGTKMLYEIKGCSLTKRFTVFGPKEPQELQNLLTGKALECPYESGKFNANWMEVFGDLDKCTGTLKDTVYELRLAQEALG